MNPNKNSEMQNKLEIIEFLYSQLSDNRAQKIKDKSNLRTKYITVVLEDIFQSHNMSAAVRSCEGFGLQQVHVIEDRNRYVVNQKVVKGAADWVNIIKHYSNPKHDNFIPNVENQELNEAASRFVETSQDSSSSWQAREHNTQIVSEQPNFENTRSCFEALRADGYRIVATTPHEKDKMIYDLPIETGKIALVFGTEETGLSKYAMENADEYVKIPMYGFTESFNISVSVAICLYELTKRLRASDINWKMPESDIIDLQLEWLRRSLPHSELLEKYYIEQQQL